ncbi:MAG: outer membrane beta-barrel protein [Chitinophagaceae bacterium]
MENPYNHTEFEDFLKEQADQLRLYPAEQSWRHIQHELHGYKKWPALTTISVFVISLLVIGTLIIKPEIKTTIIAANTASLNDNASIKPSNDASTVNGPVLDIKSTSFPENLTVHNITQNTIASVSASLQLQNNALAVYENNKSLAANAEPIKNENKAGNATFINGKNDNSTVVKNTENPRHNFDMFNFALKTISQPLSVNSSYGLVDFKGNQNNAEPFYFRYALNTYTDYDVEDILNTSRKNYSLDALKNSVSKLDFQFYLTPSVSYRRLTDNAQGKAAGTYVSAISLATSPFSVDVNKLVKYRPSIGYEVGFSLGYHFSDRLSLKSGLQFNMDQYNIDAYLYQNNTSFPGSENEPTIFSPFLVNRSSGVSSVPFTLKNRFYQISLPIGLDYKIAEHGKLSWNVAASVQPTYTFDKEPFVVSTNFKDYADGSRLMRNWNVNGNVETYLSYKMGSVKWQVGPQFRYQFMPTMSQNYPIKEYLLNYGLKIGFTKAIK